jgi:hypothetical protein
MAEETTQTTEDSIPSNPELPEEEASPVAEASAAPPEASDTAVEAAPSEESPQSSESEPDAIQPFLDKAKETIQHEANDEALEKFLRAHIKTFREEWDIWSDSAKDAYIHMMTSQLLQREAAAIQIGIGNEFKLPVPSAQTQMFDSIKRTQVKPQKRQPVLLMPPNLRPTYSLKK